MVQTRTEGVWDHLTNSFFLFFLRQTLLDVDLPEGSLWKRNTHTLSLSLSHMHTHTHTHTLSLSLTHTHARTHAHLIISNAYKALFSNQSSLPCTNMHACTRNAHTHIIIIMYIYHALINAMNAHMIHINLHMIFYTHAEHSPTKTIYIK